MCYPREMRRISLSLSPLFSLPSSFFLFMTDARKKVGASRRENVTSLTPVVYPTDRYNVMKWGLIVKTHPRPSYGYLHFLSTSHFLRACASINAGMKRPPYVRSTTLHLRIVAACAAIAKLYDPRIPLVYRYYLFAIALTFPSLVRRGWRDRSDAGSRWRCRAVFQFKSLIVLPQDHPRIVRYKSSWISLYRARAGRTRYRVISESRY